MEESKHGVFPSRVFLDYVSTPILMNAEHSLHSTHQTENDNLNRESDKLHSTNESADNQHAIATQSRRSVSSKNTRYRNVHSWHGITHLQHTSSHTITSGSTLSQISHILRTLFSASKRNLSRVTTEEPDQSGSHSLEDKISENHCEPKSSKIDLNSKLINETDISVSDEVEREDVERLSSNREKGIRYSIEEKSELYSRWLLFLGFVANFLVLGPLLVVYWDSTWTAFNYYLFSEDCELSSWAAVLIGFPITIVTMFLQDSFLRYSNSCCKPLRYFLMRLYTYIESVVCISQWRGVWIIFTCYTELSLKNAAVSLAASSVMLTLIRSLRILPAPPVYLFHDTDHSLHYKVATFWEAKPEYSLNFLLDTLISVLFVQVLSITFWRGLWEILDFCLLPDDPNMSAIYSLVISLGLTVILLPVQIKIKDISRRLHKIHWLFALAVQDVFTVLYTAVCVTYWRGLWMLLDLHSPYRPASLFVAHGVSFIILTIGLTANTVLVRGVLRDGIEFGDYGIEIDLSYVIVLIRAWRSHRDRKTRSDGEPRLLSHETQAPHSI